MQPCVNSERISVLLKILDFTRSNPQKVLVFTNSVNEVDVIHEVRKHLSRKMFGSFFNCQGVTN